MMSSNSKQIAEVRHERLSHQFELPFSSATAAQQVVDLVLTLLEICINS